MWTPDCDSIIFSTGDEYSTSLDPLIIEINPINLLQILNELFAEKQLWKSSLSLFLYQISSLPKELLAVQIII